MASVPQNPGLKIKANISIIWVSMPPVQANVHRNQDQGVCSHKRMPETRTVCLKQGQCAWNEGQDAHVKENVYRYQGQYA